MRYIVTWGIVRLRNALHSYVVTIFCLDTFFAQKHPHSRNGDKSSEEGVWQGDEKRPRTQSSHPMECICQCTTIAYTR